MTKPKQIKGARKKFLQH